MASVFPNPVQIFEYFHQAREAFAVLKGATSAFPSTLDQRSRFFAMTPGEVDQAFVIMAAELDAQVVLSLIASSEASLRVDFDDKVKRGKGIVAKRFRKLADACKAKGRKGVPLDDILVIWGQETPERSLKSTIPKMKRLVQYRHWLAHGRYWTEKKSGLNQPDPFEVWAILQRLFNALPGFGNYPAY